VHPSVIAKPLVLQNTDHDNNISKVNLFSLNNTQCTVHKYSTISRVPFLQFRAWGWCGRIGPAVGTPISSSQNAGGCHPSENRGMYVGISPGHLSLFTGKIFHQICKWVRIRDYYYIHLP